MRLIADLVVARRPRVWTNGSPLSIDVLTRSGKGADTIVMKIGDIRIEPEGDCG